jgi:hypothetical protein
LTLDGNLSAPNLTRYDSSYFLTFMS